MSGVLPGSGCNLLIGQLPHRPRIPFLLLALCLRACAPGHVPLLEQSSSPSLPVSISTPAPSETVTLALGGDVMLGRFVNQVILAEGPLYPWGDVLPLLRRADLALVNLECTIAEAGDLFQPRRSFYFRAHPKAIDVLTQAGVDFVSLANNHALDFQGPALLETIQHLDEHGISHAGAGRDAEEAAHHALLGVKGIRVGVVAFADHFREYAATPSEPGINFIPITTEETRFRSVKEGIEAARACGANLVIFSIHWGPNFRQVPPLEFQEFAHAVMDAGADIFFGHSAHIFQGVEIYKGKPIFYDTGDLVDDYYVDPVHRNDQQMLFLVYATAGHVVRVELIPVLISDMQVNRATGSDLDEISDRLIELSVPMGTEIERKPDRLVIRLP